MSCKVHMALMQLCVITDISDNQDNFLADIEISFLSLSHISTSQLCTNHNQSLLHISAGHSLEDMPSSYQT